jgi:general secretion pathway protein F
MAVFEYVALNPDGKKQKGLIESDTARLARAQLREQQLIPVEVEPIAKKESNKKSFSSRRRINSRNLALITSQLTVLLRSGLPLEEALYAVSNQTEKSSIRKVLADIRAQVLEGQSLADSISRYPLAFSPLYRATIEAGETSGKLDLVLGKLADYVGEKERLQQKMQLALIYPVLLTLVSIAVITGLLTYVVPEIVGVFEDTGQRLPALTQGLITISDFLRERGIYLLGALGVAWLVGLLLLRIPSLRFTGHKALLSLPITASYIRRSSTARFARTLAILTGSGVTLLEALQIAGQVLNNLPMRKAVEQSSAKVREGMSLNQALDKSGLFPPIALHLINSGEMSGQLPEMLETLADNQEQEVHSFNELLVGIFEPALILVMGGVVLIIVLAILMPIFEMNQLIG